VGAWWLVWAAWTARGLAGHGQHWFLYSNNKHKEIPRTLYKQLDDHLQSLQEKGKHIFIYIAILNCNLYLMKMYVKWSKYNS
jgi:hypothetical protein